MDPAQQTAAAPLAYDPAEENPLVRALLAHRSVGPAAVEAAVAAGDEMLDFLIAAHGGDRDQGLVAYFTSGLSIARTLGQVVEWRFGGWEGAGRVLDFASGWGRVTRFLVREIPPERLWVAEVLPEAVAFQASRFGVNGLVSAVAPEGFRCDRRFDAVFATSLFTHLPEESFRGWLARLARLVAPGGMLVFSTHDVSLLAAGDRPPGGLRFLPVSESRELDTGDYGSTWVSEPFVRGALQEAAPHLTCLRLPRALTGIQDLYIAADAGGAALPELACRGEPRGYVEAFDLDAGDGMTARGWAIDGGSPVQEVRLVVDGRVAGRSGSFGPRPDVEARFGVPADRALGWEITGAVPPGASRSQVLVAVEIVPAAGDGHLVYLSSLEAALLWSAHRDLDRARGALEEAAAEARRIEAEASREIAALRRRIAAMEASRFWKARNLWFRCKKALGLVGSLEP